MLLYIIVAVILLVAVGFYVYKNFKSPSANQPYFEMTDPTYNFADTGFATAMFSVSSVNGGYENLSSLQLDVVEITNTAMFSKGKVDIIEELKKLNGEPYTIPSLTPGSSYTIKLTATNKSGDSISKEKTIKIEKTVLGTTEMTGSSVEIVENEIKVLFPDVSKTVKTYNSNDGSKKEIKSYDIIVKLDDITVYYKRIEIEPINPVIHKINIGQFQPETNYDVFISSSDVSLYQIGSFNIPQSTTQSLTSDNSVKLTVSDGDIFPMPASSSTNNTIYTYLITDDGLTKLTTAGINIESFNIFSMKFSPPINTSVKYKVFYGDINDPQVKDGETTTGELLYDTNRGTRYTEIKLEGINQPVDFNMIVPKPL